jgi:hypothetical protein
MQSVGLFICSVIKMVALLEDAWVCLQSLIKLEDVGGRIDIINDFRKILINEPRLRKKKKKK